MSDYDLFLAQQLQEEFDKESGSSLNTDSKSVYRKADDNAFPSRALLSVIDPSWETTDPNPDVHALFLQYNDHYFGGKLSGVEVKWSPRMTLCAGVCTYEGRGGLCSIRLSVPLLKLRPRKDLVETLLHEMIHAFLFVTENDRDRDDHGPNFQKHMYRINKASGAHITIYHDFHGEVDSYRQHWWRCDGPCQKRHPYYGWVKRAMNRAPSAQDFWWEDHRLSCGGSYVKVKEPEGYGLKKKKGKEEKKGSQPELRGTNVDIRLFLGNGNALGTSERISNGKKMSNPVTVNSANTQAIGAASTSSGNKAIHNKQPDLPVVEQRNSGIWSTESTNKDTFSKQISTSTQPKNWSVAETGKERVINGSLGDSVKPEKDENRGYVLGSNSSRDLNWLARMRKEWTSANSYTSKTASAECLTQAAETTGKLSSGLEASESSNSRSLVGSQSEKTVLGTETKPVGTAIAIKAQEQTESEIVPLISDDDSFHYSFYVSSADEDNWPSPESCPKIAAPSVSWSKRKRTIDLGSSDEEDCTLAAGSKINEPPTKSRFPLSRNNLDTEDHNIFWHIKSKHKTPLQFRTDIEKASKQSSKSSKDNATNNTYEKFEDQTISSSLKATATSVSNQNLMISQESAENNSFVDCPSCLWKILATNINDHLDVCLT